MPTPDSIAVDAHDVGGLLPKELGQERVTWQSIVSINGDLRDWMADAPRPG